MNNRSGIWKQNLSGEAAYQSFTPAPLPPVPALSLDGDGLQLLIKANRQLSYLEGAASRIPSLDLFVSMYVRKEALLSSQIEGTQATLEDVLDPTIDANTNRNVADVINYIKATEFALERLHDLPLCNRLIRETHGVLMAGVRGQEKNPGEFRRSQNWIGGVGSTLKNARFIPPAPEDVPDCMSDLEKYINVENETTDPLIRAALIHYQFETIHPFLDGNGRIGRLLITLFLLEKKVLSTPALYISYFLKRNRTEYYDRMTEVRRKGDYEQWVRFFLQALIESAEDAVTTINQLSGLREENMTVLEKIPRNQTLLALFAYLEKSPIIEIRKTASDLGVAYNTVSKAVNTLMEKGILQQDHKTGRSRTFSYERYLEILRRDTA